MVRIRVWCVGREVHYRRQAMQAADGTWYTAWVMDAVDPWMWSYHWKWACTATHVTHDMVNKPVLYGGSKYGYNMCMQHLRKHMERYHGFRKVL